MNTDSLRLDQTKARENKKEIALVRERRPSNIKKKTERREEDRMISTSRRGSGDWPAGTRKREQARYCTGSSLEEQNEIREYPDESVEQIVETWLLRNYPLTSGESTPNIYRKLLLSLRAYLQAQGLDLDSSENQLTPLIQTWASSRSSHSKHRGTVAPATYNQRIAAIHSFYSWVNQQQIACWPNPTEALSRITIQKYTGAHALDVQQVRAQLKSIDRSSPRGQRDYVLLQVALNTGRSARELASLNWGNVDVHGENVMLTFEGGRGGKVLHDMLDNRLSRALLDYLRTLYGQDLQALSPHAPIWVSFSDRTYGQAIGQQTIADICKAHLGISRTRRLRHTFALTMDQVGASVETIQTRLGHENRATTDIYLANLKRAHNPYAGALAESFGL
jgi:site-specific recombinase XerD